MNKASRRILELCSEAKTLRVTLPGRFHSPPSSKGAIYVFNRVNADAATSSEDKVVRVRVEKLLHCSNHSTVYLGNFREVQVVLKCCDNVEFYRDFKQEAKVYEKRLGELQGDVVPAFFGYYRAEDEEFGPYSLLLLEYCGESLPYLFHELTVETRANILTVLGKFHMKSRLHPTDFAERNIVVRNGKARLIDFHDFKHHVCDWTEDVDWQVGAHFMDAKVDFPCDILAELAMDLRVWSFISRPIVKIHGRVFPAEGLPPQDVIDSLVPPNFIPGAKNWKWIEEYLREMKVMIDKGEFDIEKQIALRPLPPIHSSCV